MIERRAGKGRLVALLMCACSQPRSSVVDADVAVVVDTWDISCAIN